MAMFSQGSSGGLGSQTFNALQEAIESDRSVASLSRFVEWFSGDNLDSVWDQNSLFGAPTFGMVDDINQGFFIANGAVDPTQGSIITGNTERQFSFLNCRMESVQRRVLANGTIRVGLSSRTDGDLGNTPTDSMVVDDTTNTTFKRLVTTENVSTTATNTSIPIDTNFFRAVQELKPTFATLRINGETEATITTNLPLLKMHAGMRHNNVGVNAGESRIRFMEVLNT